MSASKTVARIKSLAQSWPKDPLRPAQHLQLGHAINKNMTSLPFTQFSPEELEYADKAVSALESIREGRESRAVSQIVLHYSNLPVARGCSCLHTTAALRPNSIP